MINASDDALFPVDTVATDAPKPARGAAFQKQFRPYDQHQSFLLPPNLDDWLGEKDEARFISDVVDVLDLDRVYAAYRTARGGPPFDPSMMLKVLMYAYAIGVTSSREIARRCDRDIGFRWLSGNQVPDYRSIARFRRRHLDVFDDLFMQVLRLCAEAGLVKMGRVALDGTKIQANASKHKAMSYSHIDPAITALEKQIRDLLAEAEEVDTAEDAKWGEGSRGDEIPKELAKREARLQKLRAAKEDLEADAAARAQHEAEEKARKAGKSEEDAAAAGATAAATAVVVPKAQRNFTDPEARIMKTGSGFSYGYNGQAVATDDEQIIVAVNVTQDATDMGQLVPMTQQTLENLARVGVTDSADALQTTNTINPNPNPNPNTNADAESEPVVAEAVGVIQGVMLADAGYCSEKNLAALKELNVDALIATGRQRRGETLPNPDEPLPENATLREQMAHRMKTSGRAVYARRKAMIEPVFGQMKTRQKAGQFRLRGKAAVTKEFTFHALIHNIRKLRNADIDVHTLGAVVAVA
jgi:transposase